MREYRPPIAVHVPHGTFPSISAAAKACGVTPHTISRHLDRGNYDAIKPGMVKAPRPWRKPVVWNGVEYPSIAEAARATGTPKGVIEYANGGRETWAKKQARRKAYRGKK